MRKIYIIFNTLLLIIFLSITGASEIEASDTASIFGPDLIQKEQHSVLTLSDILNLYSSNVGGVSAITDNYTGNGSVLGIYSLELYATSGINSATKEIQVEVLSTIGYKVRAVTDRANIHITKTTKLNPTDIVNIHNATGLFNLTSTSQMSILTDEYSDNFEELGKYLFEYRVMDASGFDKTITSYITVYDSDRLENPIIIVPEEKNTIFSILKKIFNYVVTILAVLALGYLAVKIFKKGRKVK